MIRRKLGIRETFMTVLAEEAYQELAEQEVIRQRQALEGYIEKYPRFRSTLEPWELTADAPQIVQRMSEAAARAGVGPMAAVAGAIAQMTLEAMIAAGARHALVENGGDMAMILAEPVTVGLFTGPARIRNIGLRFPARDGVIGLCTSSGTVGHSLSFGIADAATVIAGDAILADAMATALGNAVKERQAEAIQRVLAELLTDGVTGMLVVADDLLVVGGAVPEIVPVRLAVERISQDY